MDDNNNNTQLICNLMATSLQRNVISISAGIGITAILKLSPESDEDLYIKLASNPGLKILYYLYHLV